MHDFLGFIANKGRHFGTFYVAVHSPDILDTTTRKEVGNLILSPGSIDSIKSQRTNASYDKDAIISLLLEL